MITDPAGTMVLSSMGWVDGDALWRLDVTRERAEAIPLGTGARYHGLFASGSNRFAMVHHFDGARFEVTVHRFESPAEVLARATVTSEGSQLDGEPSLWQGLPHLYVEYLRFDPWDDYVLVRLFPEAARIEVQRFEWFDHRYDKGYQGIVGVVELQGENLALVSVQRSSRLVLHDLATGQQMGTIDLAGRAGNPVLEPRPGSDELWAVDYDTMVVVRRKDRRVIRKAGLQGALPGTQQFVGEFSFAPDQDLCVVARPFSGDVVAVDTRSLRIKRRARLGQQPLDVAALPGGQVVARDWKTGALLRGGLEPTGWFGR